MPKVRNNDNMELAGKDAETLDHLDIAGGKAKWYSHSGDSLSVSSKPKRCSYHGSATALPALIPENIRLTSVQKSIHACL